MRVADLVRALEGFPNRVFADYILSGFRVGFRVGFEYSSATLSQARCNLASAREHAVVVDWHRSRVAALSPVVRADPSRRQPVLRDPKSGPPGRWRLNVDLSSCCVGCDV